MGTTSRTPAGTSRTAARHRTPRATVALSALAVLALLTAPLWPRPGPAQAVSDAWPADAVVYHVFVDRFADGDAPGTQVAGDPDDPGYADALTDWMGGDLAGVHTRLDHIVASGANTIWLSPVTPGPFFHGYHPTDLTDVDPRFGDVEALRHLVADAHARGLRVIYDLVLNHTSDQHPWFVAARADCAGAPTTAYYRFRTCPDDYAAFANLPELPQLDLDHPPLRTYVFDEVLPFWLDDIGVDGFRLDHVEGPSRDFWRALRAELDTRWPGTLLLGEVWASQPIIDSYADVLDAATAFPLRERSLAVFAQGGDVRAVSVPVAGLHDAVHEGTSPRPATYLSSHDQPRFSGLVDGDLRRVALAYTALLTLPGMPVLYYGDEVGVRPTGSLPDGAPFADRWFREPMPWDPADWDTDLHATLSSLARLRTTSSALRDDADHLDVVGEGPVWVYLRTAADGSERLLVVLNTAEEPAVLTLDDAAPDEAAPDDAALSGLREALAGAGDVEVALGDPGAVHATDPLTIAVDPLDAVVLRLP